MNVNEENHVAVLTLSKSALKIKRISAGSAFGVKAHIIFPCSHVT
jgi:hypothetical protein